jgi:hypothetical protein
MNPLATALVIFLAATPETSPGAGDRTRTVAILRFQTAEDCATTRDRLAREGYRVTCTTPEQARTISPAPPPAPPAPAPRPRAY